MIPEIILIIIALAGFPIGLLVAKMTKEELKAGRKWFRMLAIAAAIALIASIIFASGDILIFLAASFIFIFLFALASLICARNVSRAGRK